MGSGQLSDGAEIEDAKVVLLSDNRWSPHGYHRDRCRRETQNF